MVGIHLDSGNGEVTRWIGRDCLEASVGLRLETVAHREHLNIVMRSKNVYLHEMMSNKLNLNVICGARVEVSQ